jgi:hypothetical protein
MLHDFKVSALLRAIRVLGKASRGAFGEIVDGKSQMGGGWRGQGRGLQAAGYRNSLNPISYLLSPSRRGLAAAAVMALALSAATGWGQILELNGGFEGSATIDNSAAVSSAAASKWTKNNTSTTIAQETTTVRTGGNALRVNNSSTSGRRVWSPLITTNITSQSVTIQLYRRVADTTNTQEEQRGVGNGTTTDVSSGSYGKPVSANAWEKVTYTRSSASFTSIAGAIFTRQTGTGGNMFIDDVAMYTGSVDTTAPNSPTSPSATVGNAQLTLSWTAASGGVDGGGYMVVRGTSDPTAAPNVNGIYATGNNVFTGQRVVYVGTSTTFTDSSLLNGTTYYYRIYTFDKAYNYSSAATTSGVPAVPVATISGAATATAFTTTYGSASSAQSFSVSGSSLTANLVATAPTGFEVSSDGTTYGSTATFTQSGGSASGTLRVRFKADAAVSGSYNSQNIVLSSTGATSVNIATASSGNAVSTKALTITGLSAANKNWDGTTTASVTGTPAYSGLVNGESFAVAGTVTWAFADANVGANKTLTRTDSYDAPSANYTVTQPTLTASINAVVPGAPTITGITAGNAQLSVAFTAPSSNGGASITNYEYSTDAGSNWTTPSPAVTASPLLITGLNNGTTYDVQIRAVNSAGSGTATSTTQGTPVAPSSPTITVTPATLASALSTTYGTASSTANFTVSGSTLSGNLTVTPPSGVEVSLSSGTGFADTLTLTESSGSVSATTVYARLKANAAAGNYNGQSISVSGGGVAVAETVATSGSGNTVAPKVITITGLGATGKDYDGTTSVTITGTAAYDGLANGESHSVTDSVTWTFPDKNIGTGKVLNRSAGYTAPNANYSLSTQPSLTADITAKELTGSFTANNKAFDNSTAATVATRAVSGAIEGDTVNHTGGTATFADVNVGNSKTVTLAGATLTGGDAGNYTLTSVSTTTADITQGAAEITFAALPAGKKVGDAAFSAGATATLGATISYNSSNTAVATVNASTGLITLVAPGVTTITATVAGTANFTGDTDSQTLNVAAAGGGSSAVFTGTYSFTGSTGDTNSLAYNGTPITNLTPSDLTKVGVTTSSSSGNSRASNFGTGSANGGAAGGSRDTGKYFEFSITAGAGFTVTDPTITFGVGRSAAGPRQFEWRSSLDNYATAIPVTANNVSLTKTAENVLQTPDANSGYTGNTVSRTTSGQSAITFRFYAYGAEDSGGTGGLQGNLTFSGTLVPDPAVPAITPSGTFAAVSSTFGSASAASATTVTVTGGSLTANITATAPTGFEVSSDGTTYGETATFTQTDGFANGTLYLRLAASAAVGAYNSQVVTLASTGASNQTVSIANSSVSAAFAGAPSITGITAGDQQLSVAFTAPASNGGASITNYEYSLNGGSTWVTPDPAVTSSPLLINGLTNGTTYDVQIRAVNSAGGGAATATSQATPEAPAVPTLGVAPATFASALSTTYGTASSTANFTVTGAALNGTQVTVTPAAGLEVSTSSNFTTTVGTSSSPLSLGTSASISTTVYVRLAANAAAGNYNGQSISVSGGGVAVAETVVTSGSGNTVAPKAVTITGLSATGKVYDGTTSVTITGTAAYDGLANGESHSVTDSVTWTFPDKNIGAGKVLNRSAGYTAPNANYSLSAQPSLTADITAKELTGSFTADDKAFDNSTTATVATRAVSGAIEGDTVNHTGGTATFSDVNVANGKTVTLAGATLTGGDAGNYTLTSVSTTTANITQGAAAITFGALPAGKKVGDAAFSAGATTTLGTISYTSSNTAVATVNASTGSITLVAPGVTTITATVAGEANFTGATASQTLNVGGAGNLNLASDLIITGIIDGPRTGGTPKAIEIYVVKDIADLSIYKVQNYGNGSGTASPPQALSGSATAGDYLYVASESTQFTAYFGFSPDFVGSALNVNGNDVVALTKNDTVVDVFGTIGVDPAADTTFNYLDSWFYRKSNTEPSSTFTLADWTFPEGQSDALDSLGTSGVNPSIGNALRMPIGTYSISNPGTPGITATGSFAAVSTTYGTASAASATTATVTGGSLTANITATAPTGFQVSSDGTTYGSTATFTQTDGFANGTLYLRLAANAAAGSYNDQVVTLSSSGASNQTLAIGNSSVTAGSLASGDITLTPGAGNSYTASGPAGSTFTIGYAGRTANGIATTYSSSSAPTAAGYYTATATATGNYTGSNMADFYVAGPVLGNDSGASSFDLRKPQDNSLFYIDKSVLLANDKRIDTSGNVQTTGLDIASVTAVTGSISYSSPYIIYTPTSAATDTFTYSVTADGVTATATVTVVPETSADVPTFTLQIVRIATAPAFAEGNTTVTVDFIGVPNKSYEVMYKGDLGEATWTSTGSHNTGESGSFSVTVTKAGDHVADWASMFFQAKVNP